MQVELVVSVGILLFLVSLSRAIPLRSALPAEVGHEGQWKPVYQLAREWQSWKAQHKRRYASDNEELERHLVWLSNMKYIEGHNANKHMFGYHLSINQYGDMVGRCGLEE